MVQAESFAKKYPKLFHMAEAGSWPSIQQHGLLSTLALLDIFEIRGEARHQMLSHWRPRSYTIGHPDYGTAIIRDQHPMPPDQLERVLKEGLTPRDWYEFLNRRCFLWVTEERLLRMLKARPYNKKKHDVITLDTRALVERDSARITLSPINTGALRGKAVRGLDTFQGFETYPLFGKNGGTREVAELAVDYRLANVEEVALSVTLRQEDKILETIWER